MSRWPTPLARFESYVDKSALSPGGCWPWRGPRESKGYGQLWWDGRLVLAARLTLRLQGLVFRPGECALHRCDNPPCVNPDHLFVGSKKDNSDDMVAKGRDRKARGDANGSRKYPERLPRGESHVHAKLTDEQVTAILGSADSGEATSRRYAVTRSAVNRIRRGTSWRHRHPAEQPRRKRRLLPEDAAAIRASTTAAPLMAHRYRCSLALIYRIRRGELWKESSE